MRLRSVLALALLVPFGAVAPSEAPLSAMDDDLVTLIDAFEGVTFSRPIFATQPPDATSRMFVVEQGGEVFVLPHPAPTDGSPLAKTRFLDLAVRRTGNEQGLLGLAFHPDYATNRKFYVHYSQPGNGATVVSEILASAGNPDAADPASERVLLTVAQPFDNHNGGTITFGPDGMLYIGLGDGGSAGDPRENGEDLGTLLGALLRIDVDVQDTGLQYGIPADNPFVDRLGARGEIWAYGLRNPWRFSFDSETGELWAGDVGQNAFEEVDVIAKGDNLGWDRREGFVAYEPAGQPPADPFVDPVHVYARSLGRSITGGYVYRGDEIPELVGAYLFADFVTGRLWSLRRPPGGGADVEQLLSTGESIASFVEDRDGELYLCTFGGRILRIASGVAPIPEDELPELLSQTRLFRNLKRGRPTRDALRYGVRSQLWSDGATKDRFVVLPDGASMATNGEDAFDVPVDTWLAKTFTIANGRKKQRLETRVIRRTAERYLMGTYRWLENGEDAVLVRERETETVTGPRGLQTWTYPSPEDCLECHTEAADRILGLTELQVKHKRGRSGVLGRWRRRGHVTGPVSEQSRFVSVKGRRKEDARARSYLASNCSYCHRPGAPSPAGLDLRASVPLEATGLLDVPERTDPGIPDARVVAPRHPERSILLTRMMLRGDEEQMPAIGSAVPDDDALDLLERWIERLD